MDSLFPFLTHHEHPDESDESILSDDEVQNQTIDMSMLSIKNEDIDIQNDSKTAFKFKESKLDSPKPNIIRSNALESKIKLPNFNVNYPNNFIDKIKFQFELQKVTDEQVKISQGISQLPENYQDAVLNELINLKKSDGSKFKTTELDFEKFENILLTLTAKTVFDINEKIERLKLDNPEAPSSYRNLYWELYDLTKLQNKGHNIDNKNIEMYTGKEFRKKMPESLQRNINFRLFSDNSIKLADYAHQIFSLTTTQVNNLSTYTSFKNKNKIYNPNQKANFSPQRNFRPSFRNNNFIRPNYQGNTKPVFNNNYRQNFQNRNTFQMRPQQFNYPNKQNYNQNSYKKNYQGQYYQGQNYQGQKYNNFGNFNNFGKPQNGYDKYARRGQNFYNNN